jgi:hypothetical protein
MRALRLIFAAVLACSCRRREEAPRPVPTETVPTGEPTRAQIVAAVCGARKPCEVLELKKAGGELLVVSLTTDPDRARDAAPSLDPCVPYEHWLLRTRGASIVERREILRLCNDGYGASGVGEDTIIVEPNLFTHRQSGGSAWRWENGRALELSPPRMKTTGWRSGSTIGATSDRGTFDWSEFRGRVYWFKPACPGAGGPPLGDDDVSAGEPEKNPRAFVYDAIPVVTLPSSFDFKSASLGSCAPVIDGVGSRGFVMHGPPGDAKDASLRVVAAAADKSIVLYVEIVDDTIVGPSAKWLFDDHLELWLKDEDPDPSESCVPGGAGGGAGNLRQWAVRVVDGALLPGAHAKVDPITVEKHENRFKITIASASIEALTVVYSDSDDGKTQERLVATSKLKFDVGATLGRLWPIAKEEAVCEVANGKLDRKLTRTFPADRPLLD